MKQVIAMHGWAGDATQWKHWQQRFKADGWDWCNGERGYSHQRSVPPIWSPDASRRLVISHSLGWHLLTESVLIKATELILLAGFSRFVPSGPPGRAPRQGLAGMAQALDTDRELPMLKRFMKRASSPLPPTALPANLLMRRQGPSPTGRERLREDLDVLTTCRGLPMGCPDIERALVLQGEEDAIVSLDVHQQLVEDLLNRWPGSRTCVSVIPAHGHALITPGVLDEVLRWLS